MGASRSSRSSSRSPGATVGQDDLRSFCREHLADYKIPRAVVVWPDALPPRNSMGKLQRFVVEKSVRDDAVPAG